MSALLRIGEAAAAAGMTTRTLRYYEQRGLLRPAHTAGGERRYTAEDVERLRHVRELADLLGADLDEIREVLDAQDVLAAIRVEYRLPGQTVERQLELLDVAEAAHRQLRDKVDHRLARLREMQAELRAKVARCEDARAMLLASLATPAAGGSLG